MKLLALLIYKAYLQSHWKLLCKMLLFIRKIMLKISDPIIDIAYRGFYFAMPFSHSIFINQKLYPSYDMQLKGIASYISSKYPKPGIIDVGANIGDTMAFCACGNATYWLFEGEKSYAKLIPLNIKRNFAKKATGGGAEYEYAQPI